MASWPEMGRSRVGRPGWCRWRPWLLGLQLPGWDDCRCPSLLPSVPLAVGERRALQAKCHLRRHWPPDVFPPSLPQSSGRHQLPPLLAMTPNGTQSPGGDVVGGPERVPSLILRGGPSGHEAGPGGSALLLPHPDCGQRRPRAAALGSAAGGASAEPPQGPRVSHCGCQARPVSGLHPRGTRKAWLVCSTGQGFHRRGRGNNRREALTGETAPSGGAAGRARLQTGSCWRHGHTALALLGHG